MKQFMKACFSIIVISLLSITVFANKKEVPTIKHVPTTVVADTASTQTVAVKPSNFFANLFKAGDKSPPTIDFDKKYGKTYTTKNSSKVIKAYVDNVRKKRDITLKINGIPTNQFKFKKRKGLVKTKVNWSNGKNIVELLVKNKYGGDVEVMTVVYNRAAPRASVCITNPNGNDYTTNERTKLIVAHIENAASLSDIHLTVNGLEQYFTYNEATGILRATVDLERGQNEIYVAAYNVEGKKAADKKIVTRVSRFGNVVYGDPCTVAPTIRIIDPCPVNPYYASTNRVKLSAKIKDVQEKRQITFIVNNNDCIDFDYNTYTDEFVAYVSLRQGSNYFSITANNNIGSDTETGNFILNGNGNTNTTYGQRPTINIRAPRPSQTVNSTSVFFRANITNITNRNQVTLNINGQRVYNFDYRAGSVTANLDRLNIGTNRIEIYAENAAGQTRKQVVFHTKANRPAVTFITPTRNGQTANLTNGRVNLKATVINAERNNIDLTVNGKPYLYGMSGTMLTANFTLVPGRHTISIKARNGGGQTLKSITVLVKQPVVAPTIAMVKPLGRTTVMTKTYRVQATVKHVRALSGITVWVNNQSISGFSFNSRTGALAFTTSLKPGYNNIKITAKNAGGTATKAAMIQYKLPQDKKPERPLSKRF